MLSPISRDRPKRPLTDSFAPDDLERRLVDDAGIGGAPREAELAQAGAVLSPAFVTDYIARSIG